MPANLITEAWLVLLLSLILSAVALPGVFLFSFLYSYLAEHNPKTSKILLMAIVTFLAVTCLVVLAELYFGYTIADVAGALGTGQSS